LGTALLFLGPTLSVLAQTRSSTGKLESGKEIYLAGCVSCHGTDGKGQAQNLRGFQPPSSFPDFSDCPSSTPEADVQWRAIVTNGGPGRAFSQIMPSFKDFLSQEQIAKVVEYLRSFCADPSWPRGNMNLPRAILTEKAFPEDEAVVSSAINTSGGPTGGVTATYEKRIGPSAMIEVGVPYNYTHDNTGTHSAVGDLALGYKRKLFSSTRHGSIFSLGGEVTAPTGNRALGTGGGSTVFEIYAAHGQMLPHDSFLQLHTGVELPVHPDIVPRAYYFHTALGKTFSTDRGLGRRWSPMMEFIADRDFATGATTNWDVIPQIQIPIAKRMHILADVGLQIPVNNTLNRPKQLVFYLLWDYVDGSLTEGWK
jgi:mono/diheme cytochrome c family protein